MKYRIKELKFKNRSIFILEEFIPMSGDGFFNRLGNWKSREQLNTIQEAQQALANAKQWDEDNTVIETIFHKETT